MQRRPLRIMRMEARPGRVMISAMGTMYYGGSATPIHIEDRALAHLKVVIATKLRRGESFTVSWQHPEDQPRGRRDAERLEDLIYQYEIHIVSFLWS